MIREYKPEDQQQTLDVWYNASVIAHHFLDEAFFEQERKNLSEGSFSNVETWVYEQDGKIVGFIAMIENEVGGLFVGPDFQGRGIGRQLMDHVRQSREYLELEVFKENAIGRRFYNRYGFKLVKEQTNKETGLPALWLKLKT